MRTHETITSAQNPKVRHLLTLQEKARLRREEGLFVVEGLREVLHALEAGYEADTVFLCEEIFDSADASEPASAPVADEATQTRKAILSLLESQKRGAHFIEVPTFLYEKIAQRGSTEGIVAQFRVKSHTLDELNLPENALVIVLENIEKPGNIGAVLRSADGAGADALIVCAPAADASSADTHSPLAADPAPASLPAPPVADLYNPNTIRSSIGAVFSVPTAVCTSEEAIGFLKSRGVRILTAQLQDSSFYYDVDMTGPTALVIGSEADGLSEIWRKAADRHILIPMKGRMDSLNASVSAAVLLYEALRQRNL